MIGSATAQNTRPTPCPVANSIANQEKYENAGLASLPPRRIEPSFVTATNMHTAKHKNAHSTIHQLQYWVTNVRSTPTALMNVSALTSAMPSTTATMATDAARMTWSCLTVRPSRAAWASFGSGSTSPDSFSTSMGWTCLRASSSELLDLMVVTLARELVLHGFHHVLHGDVAQDRPLLARGFHGRG